VKYLKATTSSSQELLALPRGWSTWNQQRELLSASCELFWEQWSVVMIGNRAGLFGHAPMSGTCYRVESYCLKYAAFFSVNSFLSSGTSSSA
jgi:hypothetical protein